ncbi:MAG: DUF58 domain-containing protein, partial [Acidobacteria bacterium]|nr:DUF58 domain-containing protein [Acidobacteriota bacterium]
MLPSHLTRDLRYLEIYTARKMRNLRAGTYTSRLRGPGFDFDEHRPYRPGDDVRRIDWNVTARFRQPFVRETHAERELNVVVALDLSASMSFGTAHFDKRELLIYVAACLAFSSVIDQINLGMVAFGRDVLQFWPPHRSKGRAWRALDELWRLDGDPGPTSIAALSTFLHRRLRTASVIFVVSDFLVDESLPALPDLRLLASSHDVVGVVLQDPAEAALFDAGGEVRVRDPESGIRRRLALTGRTRRQYAAMMATRRAQLVDDFHSAGMD